MKHTAVTITVLAFLLSASICFADSTVPNLVGTWTIKAEGGVLARDADSGNKTHHTGEFSNLTAEAIVNKQQGKILHGIFKSEKATEKFIAAVGHDNKTFIVPMKTEPWKARS